MWPPVGSPLKSKLMSMYLPKRLELSLRLVLALPKASRTQLDFSSTFFTLRGGGAARHSMARNGTARHSTAQHDTAWHRTWRGVAAASLMGAGRGTPGHPASPEWLSGPPRTPLQAWGTPFAPHNPYGHGAPTPGTPRPPL